MHIFNQAEDRLLVLLSAGNLGTTQAVLNAIQRDLDDPDSEARQNHFDYWIARHLEAENTARIVNVNTNRVLDTPKGMSPGWEPLVMIAQATTSSTTGKPPWLA